MYLALPVSLDKNPAARARSEEAEGCFIPACSCWQTQVADHLCLKTLLINTPDTNPSLLPWAIGYASISF